jgi:plastocyanin
MCISRHHFEIPYSYLQLFAIVLLVTGASLVPRPSPAEQGGATLTGRVIFRGAVPPPEVVAVTRDPEICGATRTLAPLLVQPSTHGVQYAVVSLAGAQLTPPPDPPATTTITNDHCAFSPPVETLRVGQPLEIGNRDPLLHNTHITIDTRTFVNVAMVAGGKPVRKIIKQPGLFQIRCDVHRFMQGYVVAFDHPYHTVTQTTGEFRLTGLPPGKQQLTVWHATLGTLQREVTIPTQGDISLTLEFP